MSTVTLPPSNPRPTRVTRFLLLSLALHATLLYLVQPVHRAPPSSVTRALSVTLQTQARASIEAEQKSAVAVRRTVRTNATRERIPLPAGPSESQALAAPPAAPSINLEAALTAARAYGREPTPKSLHAPVLPMTVETAIARATAPDLLIEKRGAAGEHVTQTGKTRCVTPLVVPHFLEGKTMLTQCEVRKG